MISENLMDDLERIYRRAGSRKLWSDIHSNNPLTVTLLTSSLHPFIISIVGGLFAHLILIRLTCGHLNDSDPMWLNCRLAVRYAAAITKKFASSIAPHITSILVHGKQVIYRQRCTS